MADTPPWPCALYDAETDSDSDPEAGGAVLEVYDAPAGAARRVPLTAGRTCVGTGRERLPGTHPLLLSHPSVSKHHAVVEVAGPALAFVEDLGSTNHSFLAPGRGARAVWLQPCRAYQLRHGQVLYFGAVVARFCFACQSGPRLSQCLALASPTPVAPAPAPAAAPPLAPAPAPAVGRRPSLLFSQMTVPFDNLDEDSAIPETPWAELRSISTPAVTCDRGLPFTSPRHLAVNLAADNSTFLATPILRSDQTVQTPTDSILSERASEDMLDPILLEDDTILEGDTTGDASRPSNHRPSGINVQLGPRSLSPPVDAGKPLPKAAEAATVLPLPTVDSPAVPGDVVQELSKGSGLPPLPPREPFQPGDGKEGSPGRDGADRHVEDPAPTAFSDVWAEGWESEQPKADTDPSPAPVLPVPVPAVPSPGQPAPLPLAVDCCPLPAAPAEAPAVDGPPPGGPESPPPAPLGLRRRPAARRVKPTAAALGRRSPAIVLDSDGEGEGPPAPAEPPPRRPDVRAGKRRATVSHAFRAPLDIGLQLAAQGTAEGGAPPSRRRKLLVHAADLLPSMTGSVPAGSSGGKPQAPPRGKTDTKTVSHGGPQTSACLAGLVPADAAKPASPAPSTNPAAQNPSGDEAAADYPAAGTRRSKRLSADSADSQKRSAPRARTARPSKSSAPKNASRPPSPAPRPPAAKSDSSSEAAGHSPPGRARDASGDSAPAIMCTGIVLDTKQAKKLRAMGATLLDSIGDLGRCTHLVCAKLMRTAKFLCALCVAPHIVTVGWVADSIRQGRFIDPHKFALSGADVRAVERQHGFRLSEALQRARANGPVFAGWRFAIGPNVPFQTSSTPQAGLGDILHYAGAEVVTKAPADLARFRVVTCPEDTEWCAVQFPAAPKELFVDAEFVFTAVFRQQLPDAPDVDTGQYTKRRRLS